MSVNTMSFEQSAAYLTELYKESTGQYPTLQVTDTSNFTSVATTLLQGGYDPIMGGLSQLVDRTLYAIRVFNKEFEDLTVDEIRWGSITRKVNFIDNDIDAADDRLTLTDGASVDPYIVKKPKVVQTNYYGATQYQDHITIFKDQLDSALSSPEEFGRFISGVMTNISNKHKQIEDAEARGILVNFITAKASKDSANYINVLQKYYDETGVTLTPQTMFNPTNYTEFTRWFGAFLETLEDNLGTRSLDHHMNITGNEIMRQTKGSDLRKYMSGNVVNNIKSAVNSGIYHPENINILDNVHKIVYWQNKETPYSVKATPAYLDVSDGTVKKESTAVTVDNLLGFYFDRDALGMIKRSTWSAASNMNPRGGYYNIFWHWTQQTFNDFTENAVVLYAGTVTP